MGMLFQNPIPAASSASRSRSPLLIKMSTTNHLVSNDALHQLDQRHEHLLAELDSLNERLEEALSAVGKKTDPDEPPVQA